MAVQRLQKELKNLNKEPLPGLRAKPHPNNILEWHYCLEGEALVSLHVTSKKKEKKHRAGKNLLYTQAIITRPRPVVSGDERAAITHTWSE